jgi:hypothetical protein
MQVCIIVGKTLALFVKYGLGRRVALVPFVILLRNGSAFPTTASGRFWLNEYFIVIYNANICT